jgi:uncharacterized protein
MLRNFILKLTGFCNLDCTYCYMFNSRDRSFEHKPKQMDADVAAATVRAIGDYQRACSGAPATVVLHGGEPTLWPMKSFQRLFRELESAGKAGPGIEVTMQTNLWRRPSKALLSLFREHGGSLGISLDGPREVNDANRVNFAGRGSYDRIIANVRWLMDEGYGDLIGGFLCVMQPDIEAGAFVDWVESLPIPRVNLLWPLEYNQSQRPWAEGDERAYAAHPRYGDWTAAVFEAWWRRDRPDIEIRLLQEAVEARLGGQKTNDLLGARCFDSAVVNTDGAIELADYFRTSKDGGSATGLSVLTHGFSSLERDPRFNRLKAAAETLPAPCRACDHVGHCQGGTLSGRLDSDGEVTDQPSILCHDHLRFFGAVARHVDLALAAEVSGATSEAAAPAV